MYEKDSNIVVIRISEKKRTYDSNLNCASLTLEIIYY